MFKYRVKFSLLYYGIKSVGMCEIEFYQATQIRDIKRTARKRGTCILRHPKRKVGGQVGIAGEVILEAVEKI